MKKEVSGIAGGKREYSAEEQLACSIEAMRNGSRVRGLPVEMI